MGRYKHGYKVPEIRPQPVLILAALLYSITAHDSTSFHEEPVRKAAVLSPQKQAFHQQEQASEPAEAAYWFVVGFRELGSRYRYIGESEAPNSPLPHLEQHCLGTLQWSKDEVFFALSTSPKTREGCLREL